MAEDIRNMLETVLFNGMFTASCAVYLVIITSQHVSCVEYK